MSMKAVQRANKYLDLIRSYTDGEIEASEFMHTYLTEFKEDYQDVAPDEPYEVLEQLFFACDVYCDDPELRGKHDIGERQFFKEAAYARRRLEEMLNEMEESGSNE
ncbi:hypothetical protein EGO51_18245 [Haloarcula hispanica]|uniref:Colicin D immunity protein domain-containing protein n=2 Tax=Haloarculaceae TaxID=1963268 RepID=A0A5J5LDM6_HALHI|nr:hypothetical protein EGO51_18245 [Haloarcula hispanica]KZX48912.1 hypothetical protein AV929_19955 [Haloarcula sp. K1]